MNIATDSAKTLSASPWLDHVQPEVAMACTALYGRRVQLNNSPDFGVKIDFLNHEITAVDVELSVRCAGHVFRLQLADIGGLLDDRWLLVQKVPESYLRSVVLAGAADVLRGLEASMDGPIEVLSAKAGVAAWAAGAAIEAKVEVRRGASGPWVKCSLRIQAANLAGWRVLCTAVLPYLNTGQSAHFHLLQLGIFAEPVLLSLPELLGLAPGDVLLLTSNYASEVGLLVGFSASEPCFKE